MCVASGVQSSAGDIPTETENTPTPTKPMTEISQADGDSNVTEAPNTERGAVEPRAVTIANNKGGVGKTAITINVAERLAARGHNVLVVDTDPAGNLTEGIGLKDAYEENPHFGQLLAEDEEFADVGFDDVIRETEWFDVMPSNTNLGTRQNLLDQDRQAFRYLEEKIVQPLLGDVYDYILIDTEASSDSLFMDASIWATQNILIPAEPAEESLRGLQNLLEGQIADASQHREVNILALVLNRCGSDNEVSRVIEELNEHFHEKLPSFTRKENLDELKYGGLRERVAIKRSWRDGLPLAAYDSSDDQIKHFDELARIVEEGGINE